MSKAKDIVRQAYQTAQILGEGQQLSGEQLENGLQLLNESVYSFNLQQFLPWTRRVVDVDCGNANALVLQPVEDGDDPVVPLTDKVYSISSAIKKTVVPQAPVAVESVSYTNGVSFIPLKKLGFSDLQKYVARGVCSVPAAYAFERGVSTYSASDKARSNARYGIVYLDRGTSRVVRVVYNESVPSFTVNSPLDVPDEYEQLFRYDTAWRLVNQKFMPDDVCLKVKAMLDPVEKLIKDLNASDHTITYEDEGFSDYLNILSPRQWDRLA